MPRKRIYIKNKKWNRNKQRKFRIGNRKGGVSALTMTTKDLLSVLATPEKSKYHDNAKAVLKYRGNISKVI